MAGVVVGCGAFVFSRGSDSAVDDGRLIVYLGARRVGYGRGSAFDRKGLIS